MASDASAGLIGKVQPELDLNASLQLSDAFKDFLNETSSSTASSGSSVPITIGDKSAASGHASTGGGGLVKTVIYAGLLAGLVGVFLYWDSNRG